MSGLGDERRITELLASYGYFAGCYCDNQRLASFWPEPVTQVSPDPGFAAYGGGRRRWEGLARLETFIKRPKAYPCPGFYRGSLHLQGNNLEVRIDGNRAVATSYCEVLQEAGDDRLELLGAGTQQWWSSKVTGSRRMDERRRRDVGSVESAEFLRTAERDDVSSPASVLVAT
jgi:hypothetical protein